MSEKDGSTWFGLPTASGEPELAAGHDRRAAADLDTFDLLRGALRLGVQRRGPPDLGALGDLDLLAEADSAVVDAVVVGLDRQLGALHPERGQQRRLVREGLPRRHRLLHPAEDDPVAVPLERYRHYAGTRLEPDLRQLERRREDERRPERRVPRERQLGARGEDPDPSVAALLRLEDEDRLAEVHLARERLEHLLRNLARVGEDRERVPGQRAVGEDVREDVAEGPHTGERTDLRAGRARAQVSS